MERFRPDNLDDCPEVARGLDGREARLLSKMGAPWVQIHSDGDQDSILPEAKNSLRSQSEMKQAKFVSQSELKLQ